MPSTQAPTVSSDFPLRFRHETSSINRMRQHGRAWQSKSVKHLLLGDFTSRTEQKSSRPVWNAGGVSAIYIRLDSWFSVPAGVS